MEDQEKQTWSKGNYAKAFDSETKQQKINSFSKGEHVNDDLGDLRNARKQLDNLEPPTERKEKSVSAEDRISEEEAGFRVARQRLGEVRPRAVRASSETTGTLGESAKVRVEEPKEGVWSRFKSMFRTSNTEQAVAEKSHADFVDSDQAGYKVAKERLDEPRMSDVQEKMKQEKPYHKSSQDEEEYRLANERMSYRAKPTESEKQTVRQEEPDEKPVEGADTTKTEEKEKVIRLPKVEETVKEPVENGVGEFFSQGFTLERNLDGGKVREVYGMNKKGEFTVSRTTETGQDQQGHTQWKFETETISKDELDKRLDSFAQSKAA